MYCHKICLFLKFIFLITKVKTRKWMIKNVYFRIIFLTELDWIETVKPVSIITIFSGDLFRSRHGPLIPGKAPVSITMALFHFSVTVSRDSQPACVIAGPWSRALQWKAAVIHLVSYTCVWRVKMSTVTALWEQCFDTAVRLSTQLHFKPEGAVV